MAKLSHTLNPGLRWTPSPRFRLRRRTLGGIPPPENTICMYTVSIHLPDLRGQIGVFQGIFRGEVSFMLPGALARLQSKIIPALPCLLSLSPAKPRSLSEKMFALSETDKVGG